jgi:hypothetical protein
MDRAALQAWPCLVISRDTAPENARITEFRRRLPAPWPLGAPALYPAVWGAATGHPASFGTQQPGAWGCWRTHVRIWEDMLSRGWPGAIVFEDDCVFAGQPDAWGAAAGAFLAGVPDDWDLAYLGGQHLTPPMPVPGVPGIVRGRDVNRTHAYLVRATDRTRAGYWRLCDMRAAAGCRPHIDYVLGELQRAGTLTAYCPQRWLCGQAAGVSEVTGNPCTERYWQ